MTNATTLSAIDRLKAAGQTVRHDWDEEGVVDTIEYQVALAPGMSLHYFDTDESTALSMQGTAGELEFYMTEELAEMFLRSDTVSALEMFAALGKARI